MGGQLIQKYGFPAKRLSKFDFLELTDFVTSKLNTDSVYNKLRHKPTQAYFDKETFGDLDYVLEATDINYRSMINALFEPTFIHHNAKVYSFDIKGFQVDFILLPKRSFNYGYNYYSYNDLHNLIGRVANGFGLSHGHAGLKFSLREEHVGGTGEGNSHVMEEIILTTDFQKAMTLLGYDYNRYLKGFRTKEEIFEFVATGRYFNPDLFQISALNHTNRTRNKKRAIYIDFLDWLEIHKDRLTHYKFSDNDKTYLQWITMKFPELKNRLVYNRKIYLENKFIKDKFNAKNICEWLDIEVGPELGKIIGGYRKSKEDFRTFVLVSKLSEIKDDFYGWYDTQYRELSQLY